MCRSVSVLTLVVVDICPGGDSGCVDLSVRVDTCGCRHLSSR